MALRHRTRDPLDRPTHDGRRGSRLPVAVAAVALLGLGVWIGRASQPALDQPAAPPASPSAADAPHDWPGPTDTDHGVPVGYARTQAGAVAAAVQYATKVGRAHGEQLTEVLDMVAAADAREDFRADIEAALAEVQKTMGLSPDDPDSVGITAYAGYALDSYADSAATVRLWGAGFLVDPAVGGLDSGWGTTTIRLRWESDDWRLASFRSAEGPSPEDANTGDPRRTGRAMNEFEELWHVPPMR